MNAADSNTLLNELRRDLDEIDRDIASLLNERFTVCSEIAKEKRIQSICVENKARETEVYDRVRNTAADHPE